jgi:hypothetical protein
MKNYGFWNNQSFIFWFFFGINLSFQIVKFL